MNTSVGVSREERVASPYASRAIRNGIVQVEISVPQRLIVDNLNGNRRPSGEPTTSIPTTPFPFTTLFWAVTKPAMITTPVLLFPLTMFRLNIIGVPVTPELSIRIPVVLPLVSFSEIVPEVRLFTKMPLGARPRNNGQGTRANENRFRSIPCPTGAPTVK